jgi:hypothetical protein
MTSWPSSSAQWLRWRSAVCAVAPSPVRSLPFALHWPFLVDDGCDVFLQVVTDRLANGGRQSLRVAIDAADVVRLAVYDILRVTKGFPGCDRDESQQHRAGNADHSDQKPRELVVGAANFYICTSR